MLNVMSKNLFVRDKFATNHIPGCMKILIYCRCISTGRVCDGYIPITPRKVNGHSRPGEEGKERGGSPLPPPLTSSPQILGPDSDNSVKEFDAYSFPTQDAIFDFCGPDMSLDVWDDSIFTSIDGELTSEAYERDERGGFESVDKGC